MTKRPCPAAMDGTGIAVQFFHEVDFTDTKAIFALRQNDPARKLSLLQSHGWLDGVLKSGTLEDAAARFKADDEKTWPEICPSQDLVFNDRYFHRTDMPSVRVTLSKVRLPSHQPPRLSLVFVRWGGKKRLGEDHDVESEGDGGWGDYGSPPSDWYMAGIVDQGVMKHPGFCVEGSDLEIEILSLFIGSDADFKRIVLEAPELSAQLRGVSKSTFWMLWPADWPANWNDDGFVGYVERRQLFASMQASEAAGIRSSFPHPSMLYSHITSKKWMATLSAEPQSRLPAGVLVTRKSILANARLAAEEAMSELDVIRKASVFASQGGPSIVNRRSLVKGVVKLGWSWEARHVWFWKGKDELSAFLRNMITLDGCMAESCIVQEWVDFDFELRLFFFPSADWSPPARLEPVHFSYTEWNTDSDGPGSFGKISHERCLAQWSGDEEAMHAAHAQAVEASQFLIADLLSVHPQPVPFIRMDFMLKRLCPGKAQVVFGEYCEMGACCLKWQEGPPMVWRAALDNALA